MSRLPTFYCDGTSLKTCRPSPPSASRRTIAPDGDAPSGLKAGRVTIVDLPAPTHDLITVDRANTPAPVKALT